MERRMKKTVDFEDVNDHVILPCAERGDTLIVQPVGEVVGFDTKTFYAELSNIKNLMIEETFQNIIFDLSGARYFGTELIGAMVSIGKSINDQEGQSAVLAKPSQDKRIVLEKRKFDFVGKKKCVERNSTHSIVSSDAE